MVATTLLTHRKGALSRANKKSPVINKPPTIPEDINFKVADMKLTTLLTHIMCIMSSQKNFAPDLKFRIGPPSKFA